MLNKEQINAIHDLLDKNIINSGEYMCILKALETCTEQENSHQNAIGTIIAVVCDYFRLNPNDVISRMRSTEYVTARQYITYFSRTMAFVDYKDIGDALGNRGHSNIMYYESCIKDKIDTDENVKRIAMELMSRIKTSLNAA